MMKTKNIFGWFGVITIAVILGFLIGLATENSVKTIQAQNQKKVVSLAATNKPQVKFADLKTGQQNQKFGEEFEAKSDWVKDVSFKIESIADKPIVYLRINVNFPETRELGAMMSYSVSFGQHPKQPKDDGKKTKSLMPGGVIEFSLAENGEKLAKFINQRQPIGSITKVDLEIDSVFFEDNTSWKAGKFRIQDPNDSSKYKILENNSPR